MRLSPLLSVKREKHPELGDVIVLSSPTTKDGKAYSINTKEVTVPSVDYVGEYEVQERVVGVDLRLSKETAVKLARQLLKIAGEAK